jgi:hypothetical protein
MFCSDFEKIAGDLSAGRLMEAVKRELALHHASECSACALRLNAERTLEAGLRVLAEGAEEGEAPPHLKLALRAAFDRQVKAAPVPVPAPSRLRNLALRWTAAALVLLAVVVALLSRSAPPNIKKEDVSSGGNPAPRSVIKPDNQEPKIEPQVVKTIPTKRRAATVAGVSRDNETVTDYIPLTYLADATAMESGWVLRVELPPSALIAMGLPAPADQADSRVKADVVISDDGVARAVRFVRQDSARR